MQRVRSSLESAGIVVLEDSAQVIDAPGGRFWIGGISDLWVGRHDIARTMSYITDAAPTLLITHNPDVFPDVPYTVDLTLAGHTHGGQVRLPWFGPPIVPSSYGQRYAASHVIEGGRHLFVATGTGTSILPVRINGVLNEVEIFREDGYPINELPLVSTLEHAYPSSKEGGS